MYTHLLNLYKFDCFLAEALCVFQVMTPFNHSEFIGNLIDLVKKNVTSMSRIDDAVAKILRVKFTMGLFENPLADLSFVSHLVSQVYFLIYA